MTEQIAEYQTEQTVTGLTDLVEYQTTAAALGILREKYRNPFDVATATGLSAARTARAEIRGYRAALEKTRAELKAPVLARGHWIDAEAKRIAAELLAIEEPIDAAIKTEEKHKAEEKAAQARAEAERLAALAARIQAIRERVVAVANQDAAAIQEALAQAHAFEPDPDQFADQWPAAMKAIADTRQALATLLAEREAMEARQAEDAARLQAQRETLARLQAELGPAAGGGRGPAPSRAGRTGPLARRRGGPAQAEAQDAQNRPAPRKRRPGRRPMPPAKPAHPKRKSPPRPTRWRRSNRPSRRERSPDPTPSTKPINSVSRPANARPGKRLRPPPAPGTAQCDVKSPK